MYKELNIGEIVEHLIRIKDHNKQNLTLQEADAINDACNILTKNFHREATLTSIQEKTIFHIQMPQDTITEGQDADVSHRCALMADFRLTCYTPNCQKDKESCPAAKDLHDKLQDSIENVLLDWAL